MLGKERDILILQRITEFSTTGSAGIKRRNNGRNCVYPALPKSSKTTVKLSEKCGHLVVSIVFNDVL
jgi:hypothetical protein